jgi:aspartyl-tRNA(Asn)/glutamyl-tRNA(Gln) amidotransferase subunit B
MNDFERKTSIKIGVEIHITLNSVKKVFNLNSIENKEFNDVEAWEIGYLGTLPLLNSEVVKLALKLCSFLKMKIDNELIFDRKIYNYFDLSKGFQITQKRRPIGRKGSFPIFLENKIKMIEIDRIQIEEDTAKSFYDEHNIKLDFNRAGNPLIELVTEPVFNDVETLLIFVKQFANTLIYLGVSDAKMEKGQFRIDLNFSFKFGNNYTTPHYEIKNLNSLKNLKNSIEYELGKHLKIFEKRKDNDYLLKSETLGFDEKKQKTFTQREKSNYFYLPEINIPLIKITPKEIKNIKENLPLSSQEIWKKLNSSNIKNKNISIIFENPFFLYLINLFEKNKIKYSEEFDNFVSFFQNYIITSTNNLSNEEIKNFFNINFFHISKIFSLWLENLITKNDMIKIISFLNFKKISNIDLEKRIKEIVITQEEFKDKELKNEINLIIENENINKKILSQSNKLSNLLFGILKRRFPNKIIDLQIINNISKEISEKR